MPRSLWIAALLGPLAVACGGAGASSATRPLPSYAGRATELFDDAIEPMAVGLELDQPVDPRTDARVRERAQVGDAVMRVRVSDVTEKGEDTGARYTLGLHVLDKLAGPFPPERDFSVSLDKSSPSQSIVKNFQGRLMGKTFVAFVRLFVRPDGDRELHFHVAPDSKEEIAAVLAATIKDDKQ